MLLYNIESLTGSYVIHQKEGYIAFSNETTAGLIGPRIIRPHIVRKSKVVSETPRRVMADTVDHSRNTVTVDEKFKTVDTMLERTEVTTPMQAQLSQAKARKPLKQGDVVDGPTFGPSIIAAMDALGISLENSLGITYVPWTELQVALFASNGDPMRDTTKSRTWLESFKDTKATRLFDPIAVD